MAIVAELTLTAPELFLRHTSQSVPEAVLRIEYQAGHDELLFSAEGGDPAALEEALSADPTIRDHSVVTDLDGMRLYHATIALDRPFLSQMTLAEGINILENAVVDGAWSLKLQLPDPEALGVVGGFCRDHGMTMYVERLYAEGPPETAGAFGLTPGQREALRVAHGRGYFQDPRAVTLEELAAEMDVSPTALGRRMRRGLDTLVGRTLGADE